MAAGVQQDDGVFRLPIEAFTHLGKFHADGGGVVIRIAAQLKACGGEDAAMVVPCGVAHQHFAVAKGVVQQICAQPQCARAAQRLHGGYAVFGNHTMVRAKQ